MLKSLKTKHGELKFPVFFPDATRAVVKGGLDSRDLDQARVEGLVINTLHLSDFNLDSNQTTDCHMLMNWNKPLITDSGGFQVMSLIHRNPKMGRLTKEAAIFKNEQNKEVIFTPEKSIKLQLQLGADILICLDDCTDPSDLKEKQIESVNRTLDWAKRCKVEFDKLTNMKVDRPLLFAVVQGGNNKDLRKRCAEGLIEIGFDGYCFGGFPVDGDNKFLSEIINDCASLLPDDKPKYAMGIGTPQNIVDCANAGYNMFDCVIPTREARHKKLYVFSQDPKNIDFKKDFYSTISLQQSKYKDGSDPISQFCDCLTCSNYSLGYIYHLFKIKDMLAFRLATIHNLRFYSLLLEALKP